MNSFFTSKLLWFVLFSVLFKISFAQRLPVCGTNDSLSGVHLAKYAQLKDLTRARTTNGEKLEYRLGIDINYATYQIYNGDKERLTKEAYRFVQAASDIFEREINVKLTISFIHIWEQPEPYALDQDFDYYINVLNYWTANRFEERDAVVGFSCRGGWFYGGYRMCTSNFPAPDNAFIDVDLLCHELGHTLGSPHTHNCSWPGGAIDRCTSLEGPTTECQDGYPEGVNGSLMSYCRSVLSFHPLCQNLMRDYAEGKVDASFKLGAFSEQPGAPADLVLREPNAETTSTIPTFEWKAALRADKYRFQIARDQSFTQILEDTLIRQSHYQSRGQSEGTYFSRYRAENQFSADTWSQTFRFAVSPFTENSAPPLLHEARIISTDNLTGHFYTFAGITDYEVELTDINQNQAYRRVFQVTQTTRQSFSFVHRFDWYNPYFVRLRVKKNNLWSQWSTRSNLPAIWISTFGSLNQVTKASSKPFFGITFTKGTLHPGAVSGYLEVATDNDFRNIVFRDSSQANGMNTWNATKMLFQPILEENQSYYMRSRLKWAPQSFTEWSMEQFNAGFSDQRFEYLGQVSTNLQQTGYTSTLKNKFFKTADMLYVQDVAGGYYTTTNLKDWQTYTSSTTNGQSPNYIQFFGVAKNGDVYMIDIYSKLIKKSGQTYETYTSPRTLYPDDFSPMIVTQNAGVFFKTADQGIGRFYNGNWHFYGESYFGENRLIALATDADEQIWTVTQAGNVWKFANNQWSQHSFAPNSRSLYGLAFDNEKSAYAYGEFGVMKYNSGSKTWEMIEAIAYQPVRKIIFDKDNVMWAVAFRFAQNEPIYQALIKYKDGKLNSYSDGLNLLQENLDIVLFEDKLLLMTGGGEVHRFEENKIQRFEPKATYCTGEELIVTITSNSSFTKSNTFVISLRNTATNRVSTYPAQIENGQISFKLPESIENGSYALRTITTSPAIESNESNSFQVGALATVNVTIEETGRFTKALKAEGGIEQNFQWQLNGTDIPGATSPAIMAAETGNYQVLVSNSQGCVSKSAVIPVTLNMPGEITLLQNTPNPAGSATDIFFYLPSKAEVELEVFNLRGQNIMRLEKGNFAPGWHFSKVNAAHLPNGVYVYRLKAGNTVKTLKMTK